MLTFSVKILTMITFFCIWTYIFFHSFVLGIFFSENEEELLSVKTREGNILMRLTSFYFGCRNICTKMFKTEKMPNITFVAHYWNPLPVGFRKLVFF